MSRRRLITEIACGWALALSLLAFTSTHCGGSDASAEPTPPPGMICQRAHEEIDYDLGKVTICDEYTYE